MNGAEFTTKWDLVDGRQECVGITIHAPRGITAAGIRTLLTVSAINAQRPPLTAEQRQAGDDAHAQAVAAWLLRKAQAKDG